MKESYRNFRKEAPLQWDATGAAINPYREHKCSWCNAAPNFKKQLRVAQTEHAAVKAVSRGQ